MHTRSPPFRIIGRKTPKVDAGEAMRPEAVRLHNDIYTQTAERLYLWR